MRVTSTVQAYVALADVADTEREAAWVHHYEAAHPDVFERYYSSWSSPSRRGASATDVPRLAPLVSGLEERALELVADTELIFRELGLVDDELDVVLLVGHRSSNGWVTDLHGRQQLFLALEFLGDPPYDAVLVSHEALHLAHARRGADGWPEDVAGGLFQEGFAVAMSRRLHSGLSDSAYLWFDGDHDAWVNGCETANPRLRERARSHLRHADDDPAVKWLFTTSRAPDDLPGRAGYWLADRIVAPVLEEVPVSEVLDWSHDEASARIAKAL